MPSPLSTAVRFLSSASPAFDFTASQIRLQHVSPVSGCRDTSQTLGFRGLPTLCLTTTRFMSIIILATARIGIFQFSFSQPAGREERPLRRDANLGAGAGSKTPRSYSGGAGDGPAKPLARLSPDSSADGQAVLEVPRPLSAAARERAAGAGPRPQMQVPPLASEAALDTQAGAAERQAVSLFWLSWVT